MHYRVIDNFLPNNEFKSIKNLILDEYFPWYYYRYTAEHTTHSYDFQFVHNFFNLIPRSDYFPNLKPLIDSLEAAALLRIKANLTPRSPEPFINKYHLDIEDVRGLSGIFYINTNNGFTELDRSIRIESVENRLLLFDNRTIHAGSTNSDSQTRILLNLNFIPKISSEFYKLIEND